MKDNSLLARIDRIEQNTVRIMESQHAHDIRITKIETKAALLGALSAMIMYVLGALTKMFGK